MKLAIATLLAVISPLVVSMEPASGPQQACNPNSRANHHQPVLIRWSGWWILAAFLIYIKWARYWYQLRDPVHRRLPAGRNYTVFSGTSTPADGGLAPPPEDAVHDTRDRCSQALSERGRRSATATVSDNGPSPHPNPLSSRAAAQSLCEDSKNEPKGADTAMDPKVPTAPGPSSSSPTLSAPVQAPPSPQLQLLDDLTVPPLRIRCFSTESASKRTRSIPVPGYYRTNTSWVRPRHQSLPHESDYIRRPPRSTRGPPLRTTLYAGSRDLAALPTTQWLVLFIAVNIDVKDPEHDLEFFQEMLQQSDSESPNIHFESLSGPDATRSNIKARLTSLYLRAGYISDHSRLLVFLTGLGDKANRMCLMNDEVITEEDLRDWLLDVRTRSDLRNVQPVPIIFDICRENKNKQSPKMCHIVNLIWSCSPGQRARALGFESQSVPSSCFLLAFFLASHDLLDSGPSDFEAAFRHRMKQLGNLLLYSYWYWHRIPGECHQCATEFGGKCTPPEPQEPEGEQTGWDDVASLGAFIVEKYPECVCNIVEVLTNEMRACGILGGDKSPPFVPEILVQYVTPEERHRFRGATRPTLQTLALDA